MFGAWSPRSGCDADIAGCVHLAYDPKTGIDRITKEIARMACATCNNNDGSCGCVSNLKVLTLGRRQVWSLGGSGSAANVLPVGSPNGYPVSPTIVMQQGILTVSEASNGVKVNLGYQVSAAGVSWDNPVYFGSPTYQTGNGPPLYYDWYTANVNYKGYIRYVVQIQQDSVAYMVLCTVDVSINLIIR